MAKPEFASPPAAAPDSSARHPASSSSSSFNRVNRAPRSRSRRPSPSAVLALFSVVSASPLAVHGYPLRPSETAFPFLYPPLLHQTNPSLAKRSADRSPSTPATSTTPTPPPSPAGCLQDEYNLPDKYVLRDDGRWHKTHWSLYGSIYCPGSCPPPSSVADAVQNDINNPPGSSPTGNPPPSDEFDITSLPTGWDTTHTDNNHHSTVIVLALSVALAAIILVLFSIVFWRRKHTPKRDPEKKGGGKPSNGADDDSYRSIREAKAAERNWYKAATRWRGNLRFSARRRRTNRALAPTTSHVTLSEDLQQEIAASDTEGSTYPSRSPSPTPTVRSVASSSRPSIRSSHSQIQTPQVLAFHAASTDSPPSSPLSAQPPAYHPRPSTPSSPPPRISSELTYSGRSPSSKEPLSFRPQTPRGDDDSHLASFSGHVATDDKAILSLRAALASAPPASDSNFPQAVSVPSMEEEDMFELPSRSSPTSLSRDTFGYEPQPPYSPPTSLLPPPPSKGKQKFDYSHDWDISANVDITVEPQLGPSAPPFEESEMVPTAPPLDFDVHVPSAPPVDTEDCPAATTIGDLEDGVGADTVSMIPGHTDPGRHQSGD